MSVDPHKDFGPQALRQLDFTELVKLMLEQQQQITKSISSSDKHNVELTLRLNGLDEKINDLRDILTRHVTDPSNGVISMVARHDKVIESYEKMNIAEMVRNNKKNLDTISKVVWTVFTGLVGVAIKLIFF